MRRPHHPGEERECERQEYERRKGEVGVVVWRHGDREGGREERRWRILCVVRRILKEEWRLIDSR